MRPRLLELASRSPARDEAPQSKAKEHVPKNLTNGGKDVKSLFLLIFLAGLGYGGYVIHQQLGAPGGAYLAYQNHATARITGATMASRAALANFGAAGNTPDIQSIEYELESRQDDGGRTRIVAIQYVTRLYKDSFGNPAGRPKVSKARQHAVVEKAGDEWKVKSLKSEKLD